MGCGSSTFTSIPFQASRAAQAALYRALDRRELRLYHQPIYDLRSKEVVGFEALMRWNRNGTQICVDSVHSGERQIYIADVASHVAA